MSSIDLTTILGNLSLSLLSVEDLVLKIGRAAGVLLVISGLIKFTKIDKYSHEGVSAPLAYIFGGTVLYYLPDSSHTISNTLFGHGTVLQYTDYNSFNIYDSIRILVQTGGLIWFVRGCILLVHSAEPGKQEGLKGMLFVIAGVLALNFNSTAASLNAMFTYFIGITGRVF